MKHFIILLLFFPVFSGAQVFFDQEKTCYTEASMLIVPTISSSYSMARYDFVEDQFGMKVERKRNLPELFTGVQIMSNGFLAGVHYGCLQNTVMANVGIVFPVKTKNAPKTIFKY